MKPEAAPAEPHAAPVARLGMFRTDARPAVGTVCDGKASANLAPRVSGVLHFEDSARPHGSASRSTSRLYLPYRLHSLQEFCNVVSLVSFGAPRFIYRRNCHPVRNGSARLRQPAVFTSSRLVICLDCGFVEFKIDEDELREINKGGGLAAHKPATP